MAKRILIECTPSYSTDMTTGIQRVVRSLVEESLKLESMEGCELIPVIFFQDRLCRLPNSSRTGTGNQLDGRARSFAVKVFEACSKSKLYLYIKDKVRTHLYSLFIGIREIVHGFVIKSKVRPSELENVVVGEGDILVLADVSWGRNIWEKVDEYRGRGVHVCMVLYDLIRVIHPEFCGRKSSEEYIDFLNTALNIVDSVLSISNAVEQELIDYIHKNEDVVRHMPKLDYFHLGVNPVNISNTAHVREPLHKVFYGSESIYLIVSTIEPRKNHAYLLDAFDSLWQQGVGVKLLIVGRVGWMVDGLMHRIKSHPEFGRRLLVFHDLDDDELLYCYHNAKALVFPSLSEGFGLPIIEAMQNRLPVIASDIVVHREIAKDQVMYINVTNKADLVNLINQIENQGIEEQYMPTAFSWMDWREATEVFVKKVIKVSQ